MPKFGDEAICKFCKTPIRFTGKYWEHTRTSPRHPGEPEDGWKQKEKFENPNEEIYRDDITRVK